MNDPTILARSLPCGHRYGEILVKKCQRHSSPSRFPFWRVLVRVDTISAIDIGFHGKTQRTERHRRAPLVYDPPRPNERIGRFLTRADGRQHSVNNFPRKLQYTAMAEDGRRLLNFSRAKLRYFVFHVIAFDFCDPRSTLYRARHNAGQPLFAGHL